jgi:glycosyltransferase involved in cell wall biosynthesis
LIKKKLLIIDKSQFGYHTDSYKYCQYLKNNFDITYICFDVNQKKKKEDGIKILYVPHKGSFLQKGINYIRFCRRYIKNNQTDLIFVVYFQMASLLSLTLPAKKFILDIRTGSDDKNIVKRKIFDLIMRFESRFFKHITIVTECLGKKLRLKAAKYHILPLGSDTLSTTEKSFETIKLLYVGTLYVRNIHETVLGLSYFIKKLDRQDVVITYDIFGFGTKGEENLLKKTISKTNLESTVKFHGRKNHDELKPYFDHCNIGVSYIPIIDYFQCQPPTKTFEFINAGLPCIATSTKENKRLITQENGLLCKDTASSFSETLMKFFISRNTYDSKRIRESLKSHSWENIVQNNLLVYLNRMEQQN